MINIVLNIFGYLSGVGGSLKGVGYILLWVIPIIIVLLIAIVLINNKRIYKYKVRIFRIRENGKVKESNFKGAYIGRKNSAHFFRIKTGKFPWNCIELTTTPKVEYMDEEDRVYYKQIDVDSYLQVKRRFEQNGDIIYTPVESDVKYGAILAIERIKEVLRTEPTWKKLLPYFGLMLVFALCIVGMVLLQKYKCG